MLVRLHRCEAAQRALGLITGIAFGFLLHRGGVTSYDVVMGQLLLRDFTVLKVMISAVFTGMLGLHLLCGLGLARLHPKPGSFGSTAIGSLIFGVGFALLGYCPGTGMGALGQGSLDALVGAGVGITLGTWLFALAYPRVRHVLAWGPFRPLTIPEALRAPTWVVVGAVAASLLALLLVVEGGVFLR